MKLTIFAQPLKKVKIGTSGGFKGWLSAEGEIKRRGQGSHAVTLGIKWVRQAKPGRGGWNKPETFRRTLRVTIPARTRLASHPEASLAWWWGNPPCEA